MRQVRHGYWDAGLGDWVDEEPVCSAEVEYFRSLEPEETDYTGDLILALSVLTEKQRFAVECRYGLRSGGRVMTTQEIGTYMGVSHQAVYRLLQRAESAMRKGVAKDPSMSKTIRF